LIVIKTLESLDTTFLKFFKFSESHSRRAVKIDTNFIGSYTL